MKDNYGFLGQNLKLQDAICIGFDADMFFNCWFLPVVCQTKVKFIIR